MSVADPAFARVRAGRREQHATRMVFFMHGLVVGGWAPLVPVVKARLGIDNGSLGLLILCIGAGSLVVMPFTGMVMAYVGCRRVAVCAGAVFAALMPAVVGLGTPFSVGVALALFGAAAGMMEIAINVQSVFVERDGGRPMMSGFHALWSLGGIVGSAGISLLLAGVVPDPVWASAALSLGAVAVLGAAFGGLLPYGDQGGARPPLLVIPKGIVLVVGALCFLAYLAEGAVLDWSAVYLRSNRGADPTLAGMGYALFAVAMTAGRFAGDRIRAALGEARVLVLGGLLASAGFVIVVLVPSAFAGLFGFLLVGAGASNMVPVFFSIAGRSRAMPTGLAVASVSTIAALGVLAGPATIGLIAQWVGLDIGLLCIASTMLVIAASFRVARI